MSRPQGACPSVYRRDTMAALEGDTIEVHANDGDFQEEIETTSSGSHWEERKALLDEQVFRELQREL